jgi:hypothetical protein
MSIDKIGMPLKNDGTTDKRFSGPQLLRRDGRRDRRSRYDSFVLDSRGNFNSHMVRKLGMPKKKDGTVDKRYTSLQIIRADGKRDKRTLIKSVIF